MKIMSTYSVKIKGYNRVFGKTVGLYRGVVDFYIRVIDENWDMFSGIHSQKVAVNHAESLTVSTKNRPYVPYDIGTVFYKFPSYMRRTAIAEAYGKMRSYKSLLSAWEASDKRTRGNVPGYPKAGYVYPAMYNIQSYKRTGTYTAQVKVWIRNTWDWLDIELKKGDVDYIAHHCQNRKECVPTLQKRGKEWFLDFAFKEEAQLNDAPVSEQRILAVDLGINSSCVCSCMRSDGTVIGRHFLRLPREYDSLKRRIDHIKRAQHHGSRSVPVLWKLACGVNNDIAVKTAKFIMDVSELYSVDVIVFEHLDLKGKKHGSKKQWLHLWKAQYVQSMVTNKAHRRGIRISTVNAWGTSRLAYDGSGVVLRGDESKKTNGSYSICEFQNGRIYNCDLNASYNIGARYFVREIIKTLPVTEGQRITAKVPGCEKRSTCTLSTLISLNAELYAAA